MGCYGHCVQPNQRDIIVVKKWNVLHINLIQKKFWSWCQEKIKESIKLLFPGPKIEFENLNVNLFMRPFDCLLLSMFVLSFDFVSKPC